MQLWDDGIYEYMHDMWNFLDYVTNTLYFAVTALRLIAYLQVEGEKSHADYLEVACLPRSKWNAYDPTLVSAFFVKQFMK